MKKILITTLLLISFLKAETINLNLVDFSILVSNKNKINILIDDSLKNKIYNFTISDSQDFFLEAFKKALELQNLELINQKNIYYVREKKIFDEKNKLRKIKLDFIDFQDLTQLLENYKTNSKLNYSYIKSAKTLIIDSLEDDFLQLQNIIKSIDKKPKQYKLKLTIFEINLNKLKDYGINNQIHLKGSENFFFEMLTYPFAVANNIAPAEKTNFYSFIKLMNQKGNSKLLSSPTLTISDEKTTRFSVADNLPFKVSSSTIIDNTQSITNNIEYKDVGLIIDLLPKIYEKNHIFLDMTLNLTNIISNTDNMPITSKKYIKQEFNLLKDEIFVLTGLNKKTLVKNKNYIPILSSIPLLGWLFKSETTEEQEIVLNVILEVIEEKEQIIEKLEELEF